MGSLEASYSKSVWAQFTPTQQSRLRELHKQLDDKYEEIARLVADDLGLHEDDSRVDEEAHFAIERWEEDADMADKPAIPTTRLQQMLSEHQEISDRISIIRDEALESDEDAAS